MNSTRFTNWTGAAVRRTCHILALGGLIWPMAGLAEVEARDSARARGWKSVGPAPPAVSAAIAAHVPSHTVYLGSLGVGVLKSTDDGATFAAVNNGLDALTVGSMAMSPNDPNLVYVGTGVDIYKTTDGGATWNAAGATAYAVALIMDPTNPNVLYASTPFGIMLKTVDGGATWDWAGEGITPDSPVWSLAINPFKPSVLYAGTAGSGAFKSVDGAVSWTPIEIDSTVWSFLVDPSDGNVVYAGSNGSGVYKSTDGGNTFIRVGSPGVGVVLSLAKSGNKLYAGTATQGVSVSEDGGVTWRNTGASEGLGLALSVDSAGAVYLGTNFEGAFKLSANSRGRSGDGGEGDEAFGDDNHNNHKWRRLAWKQLKECACQAGHALAIDPSNHEHVFFSTNDGGLLVTDDGGRTWKDGGAKGLVARAPRGVAFDPQQPRRVYAGAFTGGGFFKSEDHGRHWQRRLFGPSRIYPSGVSVDPVDHSVYVATFLYGDGIWKSTDFGDTFTRIDRAPGAPPNEYLGLSGRGITVDPNNHTTVYFADNSGVPGIWRSQDAGASWVNVDETSAFSVTVDPTDSNVVYAGTPGAGVLKSTDGGATWTQKSAGLDVTRTSRTAGVQIHPDQHNVLYVGTEGGGVFKSTDGAESWFAVNLGLDDLGVFGFALDLVNPNILYASTNSSVYKTKTAGE